MGARICQARDCDQPLPLGAPGQRKYCSGACQRAEHRYRQSSGQSPREKRQIAKSRVWLFLAIKADQWADDIDGKSGDVRPFDEWPADDPHRELAAASGLTATDLAQVYRQVAAEAENRAMKAGYDRVFEEEQT